ncbi:MAG: hypothetical protein CSA62_15505 [Planctomycetota bacterium]|nr:MAG: hypothetical protein CSA62_15505 [Planctomycetota bacterium]
MRDWLLHRADQRLVANAAASGPEIVTVLTELCRTHETNTHSNLGELAEGDKMVKILFLGANPLNSTRLALDEEIREIEQKLRAARLRDSFELRSRWAVRPTDLQQALLDEEPTIAHFSGHGDGAAGLVLHADDATNDALVTAAALRSLFRVLKDNVRVVVLNACFSTEQATAIVEEIDFVVGTSDEIDDDAARFFAAAFYRGLAFGKSVQSAFDLGLNELQLNGFVDDEAVPVLLVRSGADPASAVPA